MRTIKFRALRTDGARWVYGYLVKTPITTEFTADGQFLDSGIGRLCVVQNGVAHEVRPDTVGEFTGLLDKNGKEIYEGDIVEAPHDFGPGGFHPRKFSVHFHLTEGYQWNYWDMTKAEVIGNIHENPELLK